MLPWLASSSLLFPLVAQPPPRDSIRFQTDADTASIMRLYTLATTYLATRPDSSRLIARRGLAASQKISFDRGILYHQFVLANLLHEQGLDSEALVYMQRCLPLCEKLGDWTMEARCYNEMAKWIETAGNRPQAIRYYEKVLAIGQKHANVEWITTGLNNLGDSYEQMGSFSKAEKYYLQGVSVAEQYQDRPALLFPYLSLGHLYFQKNQYEQSLEYSLKALPISEETHDWYAQVLCLNFAAEALIAQNRLDEALTYTQRALKHKAIADADIQRYIAETYKLISQIHEKKGDFATALRFHKQENSLLDSLNEIQNAEKVLHLESLFEMERQETQIKLLDAQNKKRVSQILMLAGAVGTLLIVVGLLYRWNVYRKRKNQELNQKNQELWAQNNTIMAQEEEITMQAEELRLMNERLYEWNQHLEKLVYQRTEELEQKNKKLEEYAYLNSHRLRSPLTTLMGLMNLMRELSQQGSLSEALQLMGLLEKEADRLDKVTREIQATVNIPSDETPEGKATGEDSL